MLDALILTKHDWANTGWRFFKCLQSLGLEVMMFKGEMHPFMYPEQAVIHTSIATAAGSSPVWRVPDIRLKKMVENAKVVHFTSSTIIDTGADLNKINVVLQHSGYGYRAGADVMNELFNPFVDATVIQMPDLLGLGAKNEHLIYFPVDTDFIKPVYERKSDKVLIGHFPSMPTHKGSKEIAELMKKLSIDKDLKDKFVYCGRNDEPSQYKSIYWLDHLKRLSYCDVIIDVLNNEVKGLKYGEWGNTSFEASAMGKLVITNSLGIDTYISEYGECKLNIANSINELEAALRRIITMDSDTLHRERIEAREWVERNHSIPATAERLWDKVYKNFF